MMNSTKKGYLIVNFGGPRNLDEVRPFLRELLTDQDVIRTNLPKLLHNLIFRRIARKRAVKVTEDYRLIGGRSPIFFDTEALADRLQAHLDGPVLTFHRYLTATHREFIFSIKQHSYDEIRVFPMFPQFTYATTGSCARWFHQRLPVDVVEKMRWIKSYPSHPAFVRSQQQSIRRYLQQNGLNQADTTLLFTAHGVPKKFVQTGDPYEKECQASFEAVMEAFPEAHGILAYQSQFGKEEWIRPYTSEVCEEIERWNQCRHNIVFVPISFTSDHIETLFEIETMYMPVIRQKGLQVYRVPALTLDPDWIQAIFEIMKDENVHNNRMLIRKL